jgi:hypothetical protein
MPGNPVAGGEDIKAGRAAGLDFDAAPAKAAFAHVAAHAPQAMEFYAHLSRRIP